MPHGEFVKRINSSRKTKFSYSYIHRNIKGMFIQVRNAADLVQNMFK